MAEAVGALPLEGLRVLDAADEKGELCGRILADLGASVIRVEPPAGARSRRLPPFVPGRDTSLYFAVRNAGKRGITLDWTMPSGRELLERLLGCVDVWVETGMPGDLARAGLAPADVLVRHPTLILVSISDFGQDGAYREYRGSDMIGFAMGGLMHRAGAKHRPPCVAPGALAYDSTGITAGFAALLAYWQRLQTGRGGHVDVSVQESVANMSDWSLPNYSAMPNVGGRDGAGIYSLMRCADGFVRVIVLVPSHWRALLEWMGNPEALRDPQLDQFLARLVRRAEVEPVLEGFFRERKKIDIATEAQRRGIPIMPLLEPREVLENEHTSARGTFRDLEVEPDLEARVAAGFFQFDDRRLGPRERPPLLAEHNREVYGELGLSDAELDALRAQGVI